MQLIVPMRGFMLCNIKVFSQLRPSEGTPDTSHEHNFISLRR
jgi:hypothetical protein